LLASQAFVSANSHRVVISLGLWPASLHDKGIAFPLKRYVPAMRLPSARPLHALCPGERARAFAIFAQVLAKYRTFRIPPKLPQITKTARTTQVVTKNFLCERCLQQGILAGIAIPFRMESGSGRHGACCYLSRRTTSSGTGNAKGDLAR
jgi:hypothetical protein